MATRGCFLDGCPVLDAGHDWTLTTGSRPFFTYCELSPQDAEQLLAKPMRPVDFVIDTMTIRVLILARFPADHQKVARVLICDRRWYWQHIVMDRGFNVRRHIGIRRVGGGADQPNVLDPLRPSVNYEPWSLRSNTKVWEPKQILSNLMQEIEDAEQRAGFSWGGHSIDTTGLAEIEVENLFISGPATDAMEQVLQYIPGLRMSIEPNGRARFYSISNVDEEKDIADKINPEFWGEGTVLESFTDFARVRPKEIRVLFDIEAEVRFDFEERLIGRRTTADADEREMANVLPVTDFNLLLNGEVIAQGNWVRINGDLFRAWGNLPTGKPIRPLMIRRLMTPHHDYWAAFDLAGQFDPATDWSSRINAIKAHYRRTFKIPQRWVDRYRRVAAYRVATWDPVTATRGAALAFLNYFIVGTQRLWRANKKASYGMNVQAWDGGQIEKNTVASPWNVRLVDHDQGIISIDYQPDRFRVKEVAIPGLLENVPTPAEIDRLGWDAIVKGGSRPELAANFDMSTILTLMPGSAPDRRHLFEVVIKPSDMFGVLKGSLREGVQQAEGPPVEIKVGASIETARVAWNDRRAEDIERVFGLDSKKPNLDGLVINYVKNNNGAAVWSIAVAVAAQVYASYANRLQGQSRSQIDSTLEMKGLMKDLSYRIGSDGVTSQLLRMEDWNDFSLDPQSFMPASTRRFINRIATVGRE